MIDDMKDLHEEMVV